MLGGEAPPAKAVAAAAAAPADAPSPMAPDIETSLRQAQLLRAGNDMVGATRIMSQLMLVYPDDPRVVGEYGKLLIQENRSADAVAFLRRAVELSPTDWTAFSALGVAFDQQHDPNNARLAYQRALALKPGEGAVLNNFAMSRMMAGDTATARTLLAQAQQSGSTDPRIATNLAMLDRMGAPAMAGPVPMNGPAPMNGAAPVAAPRSGVARADIPAPAAHGAPAPLVHGNGNVVMQDVPVDPLAGPVAAHTARAGKPAKVAKAGKPAATRVASDAKPVKKTAKPSTAIPALRMTADAGKP